MHIKKIGHCCLVISTGTVTIMTDPGGFSTAQNEIKGIDIVLITHEHHDHFHIDSVKQIIANNPNAKIITNGTVGALLTAQHIPFELVSQGGESKAHGAHIEGYGCTHATIYQDMGQTENTGYFIDGKLFYPGDAFTNPNRPVDILALPSAGPWMKVSDAITYACMLKPRVAFPVHDAIMSSHFVGFLHGMLEKILAQNSVSFVGLKEGEEKDF